MFLGIYVTVQKQPFTKQEKEEEAVTRDAGASEPVGTLHAIVLDVNDLESCAGFWSEVLGKEISFKVDKYCRIGAGDDRPSLLLQVLFCPLQYLQQFHLL